MNLTVFAPIVIPTLCRYTHFVRCVESLKLNKYAKDTELYIGLDYPTKESHQDGYNKIKNYVENELSGFKKIHLIINEKNLGAIDNSIYIINCALSTHDCYIYTEDDNEFSPNYLEYMNKCLEMTKNNPDIIGVSGYNYPYKTNEFTGNILTSNVYFSAWGYGMWKERFFELKQNITYSLFKCKYKDYSFVSSLRKTAPNQYCYFIKGMLGYVPELVKDDTISQIDLSYGLYIYMNNKKMIFPVISKVRNWGYDGSGSHCNQMEFSEDAKITHRNFNTSCQLLDSSSDFGSPVYETRLNQTQINNIINTFFDIPKKEILRTNIAYIISRIIGIKLTKKLIHKS